MNCLTTLKKSKESYRIDTQGERKMYSEVALTPSVRIFRDCWFEWVALSYVFMEGKTFISKPVIVDNVHPGFDKIDYCGIVFEVRTKQQRMAKYLDDLLRN